MFTGIIEASPPVIARQESAANLVLSLELPDAWQGHVKLGDSIALNGCCLTVAAIKGSQVCFELVPETQRLTSLSGLEIGAPVNIERALAADGRFDGHIVQGHVDAMGTISDISLDAGERRITIDAGEEFCAQCVHKGSVCIDGISLTIASLNESTLTVAIIPHTWELTNLNARRVGDSVNLEADILGKYVTKTLGRMFGASRPGHGPDLVG